MTDNTTNLVNAIFGAHKMGFEEVVRQIAITHPNALIEVVLGVEKSSTTEVELPQPTIETKALKVGRVYLTKAKNAKIDDKEWKPSRQKFVAWLEKHDIDRETALFAWNELTEDINEFNI